MGGGGQRQLQEYNYVHDGAQRVNASETSCRPTSQGGGGTSIIMYAYWVCAARETPIFSPEFPLRSI